MKKKISNKAILFILHGIGFGFMCLFGAYAHELARLSPNFLTKMLFPANLSLWEQGKILLTGFSVWFILEYIIVGRKIKGYVFVHTIITAALPVLMLIIYLSHSQAFGDLSLEGAHIILSMVLILTGFVTSIVMLLSQKDYSVWAPYGIIAYIIVVLMYAVFTFLPPNMSMFYDAINKAFGPVW